MIKKKFFSLLILLLILTFLQPVTCFYPLSAGTAEAVTELIRTNRVGNQVYRSVFDDFDGILRGAEREFSIAVTDTDSSYALKLITTVRALNGWSNSKVYINNGKPYIENSTIHDSDVFAAYKGSFPAVYDSLYFRKFLRIRIDGTEGQTFQFILRAWSNTHNKYVAEKTFTLTVHDDKASDHPVITYPPENDYVTSYFPGKTTLRLEADANNFSIWRVDTNKIQTQYQGTISDLYTLNSRNPKTDLNFNTNYIDGLTDGGSIGYLTIYAANKYGYEVSRDIEVKVNIARKYKTPVINNPTQELSVLYGAVGEALFTGEYISTWSCDKTALPGFIQDVTLDYSGNSNKCKVNVFLSPDAAVGSNYDLKLTASNGMNTQSATATLTIKAIGNKEDYESPVIDSDETIRVIQGGSASAVFTGRYVKRWGYKGDLPSGIDDIKFNYDSNPNRCEVRVTANADATVTTTPLTLDIYAYNAVGAEISSPKKLYIHVLLNDETAEPVINEMTQEISIVPGGTAAVTFTGKHTRTWSWEEADGDDTNPDIVENVELNYLSNPARCEVRVTLHDGIKAGLTDTINIYAYNAVGTKAETPAKLTVKVASTGDNEDPVIDESETVSVIKGGTARAIFTGQHIRSWAYGTLPEAIHAIELRPAANPNRCDVLVTAADKTEETSAKVTIYAYNAIGEMTSADLNVTILDNRDHSDPVIDCNESVSVIAGGTARAVFTGQHINSWKYGNLPDEIKAVELNYAANPNKCEVLVTASSTAAAGAKTVTIYAYNEIGEETSADLNVTIVDTRDHSAPVIDYNESVSVVAGGTARAIFTGKHINSWKYGNLPDGIKAVELNYAANPNRCDVLVTASSKAAAGEKNVTIYAYNEIGEETSADLSVTIINDSEKGKYDNPVIDGNKSVSVSKGGTARVVFTGKNIRAWYYGNLPDGIKAIELNYAANSNKCEFLVTASSAATAGAKTVTIYAYNAVGEVTDKTLTVNIIDDSEKDKYAKPVINNSGLNVNVVKGGTVYTSLSGSNITSWAYGNLPDGIKALEFKYSSNPNKCTAAVTASSAAETGARTITIYAYNEIGEVTSAVLKVNVIENSDSGDDPTIDSDDLKGTINVVPGGKISVSFDATNIYGLAYSVLPNEIEYVDWEVKDDGKKGAFFIAVSSTATVGSTLSFDVYGFNEIGEVSESADIKLTVVKDDGNKNPVTKTSEETIVVEPGEIIAAEFTSANAKNWDFNISELPNVVNAIDVSYDIDNPETCEITIIVSANTSLSEAEYDNSASDVSSAANTNHSFKVYAYNEIGSMTSGDFTFIVSDSDSGGSSNSSSNGCDTGVSSLTDLGVAGLLILIYYLVSRRRAK